MQVQEETRSISRRVGEAGGPRTDESVEVQELIVPHPQSELIRTPDEPATSKRILDNDIVESLKQVVNKINIMVDKVDKTTKVRVALHPSSPR